MNIIMLARWFLAMEFSVKQIVNACLLVAALCFAVTQANANAVVFGEGAENDWGSLEVLPAGTMSGSGSSNGYSVSVSGSSSDLSNYELPAIVNMRVFSGSKAARFSVLGNDTQGDNEHHRSELSLSGYNRGDTDWKGTVHWIGWTFYLDENWPTDEAQNSRTVLFQAHRLNSEPGCSPTWGIRARGDGTMVVTQCFDGYSDANHLLPVRVQDLRGRWVRVVAQVKYDGGNNGSIRIWFDDELVLDSVNVRTWQPEASRFGYYKVGIYAAWHKSRSASTKTMYIDSLRIADGARGGSYQSVNPLGSPAPRAPVVVVE